MTDEETIVGLTSRILEIPLRTPWGADVPKIDVVVVHVMLSSGTHGTGFSWTPSVGVSAIKALLDHDIARAVEGRRADPAAIWDHLWAHLHCLGAGGLTTMAMAGADLALWDARARKADMPLVDFIGRRRASTPVYGSGVNLDFPLDTLIDQARRWVAAGYRAVKMKVGKPDFEEDVERVGAVRQVLGPDRRLMIDANQRWDLPTARRAMSALEKFDIEWIEEPLRADNAWGYAQLRSHINTPVALGENVYTTYRFRELMSEGACDVVQPNIIRVGGITPFFRIAEVARTYGVKLAPHLLPELSGQIALTLPELTWVEDVEDASFAALGALTTPSGVEISDGRLTAATLPGLGLSFVDAADRGLFRGGAAAGAR